MTGSDQQRISEWIGDAFAILCVRTSGVSPAETNLRLGFEAILRQLGTPPLGVLARGTPLPFRPVTASASDLRHIVKALDACLTIFQRYNAVLPGPQRHIEALVRTTKCFAEEEFVSRRNKPTHELAVNAA